MKRTTIGFMTLSASLLAVSLASVAVAGNGNGAAFKPFAEKVGVRQFTGQMIIRPIQVEQGIKKGLSNQKIAKLRKSAVNRINSLTKVKEYVWQTDEYIVFLKAGVTENDLAKKLLATGEYDYVEPNWMVYPTQIPNDPRIAQQWHHKTNNVDSYGGWDIATGDPSVSIGICDTGVRTTHEDLLLHRLEGYNTPDRKWESQGGRIDDINGHGTWTTGTACANGNNGKGVSGMGWDLSHRMLRVTNSPGGGAFISDLTLAARTAVENGDKCASVSYSGVTSSSVKSTASTIKGLGGLLFWAAGNEGQRLNGDRDADDIMVVGATTSSNNKSSFSNYGPFVDFMAGGSNIFTTDRSSNSSYASVSGTSFACPMAAGLAGLIWATDPSLTPDEVENVLKTTARDLGPQGVDNTFGYGLVNSANALAAVGRYSLSVTPAPPIFSRSNVTFQTRGGDPNTNTMLFYSLKGTGLTEVANGVFVDLRNPKQVMPTRTSDGNGDADWPVKIPRVNRVTRAFMQATQDPTDNRTQKDLFYDIQP